MLFYGPAPSSVSFIPTGAPTDPSAAQLLLFIALWEALSLNPRADLAAERCRKEV